MEILFLNTISVANLLRSINLHTVDSFKFLIDIPNNSADCDTVKKLRNIVQKLVGPNINPDCINYRADDFSKGQWSLAKLQPSEKDNIQVRIDVKNAKFIYAEKFQNFTESVMEQMFQKTHQERVEKVFAKSFSDNSDSEDEPPKKCSHTDSDYDSDDLSYIKSIS